MHYYGVSVKEELFRGVLPVKDVFHVIDGEAFLDVAQADEFVQFHPELFYLGRISVQDDVSSPCRYFEAWEIAAELFKDLVSGAV